jgi:two-component system KDP operon response regulator KdpE
MQLKILIIEDDATMNALLGGYLRSRGFDILHAYGANEGLKLAIAEKPDLVILDVMMPEIDGWQAMNRLRESSSVPVIFVTAKGTQDDVVHGLQLGADDYVKKPFDLQELELRVNAVLRRSTTKTDPPPEVFDDGYLRIDVTRRSVAVRGRPIRLTPTEYRLLTYLLGRRGRPVPHDELLREVWGPAYVQEQANLHVYVRYLREKIEENPRRPIYICTAWGVGYLFGEPAAAPATER